MNQRQKQIAEAAISLFLKDGVGVSTAKIAQAAGVSNGTLFNAFATKQALIDAIYLRAKSEMLGALTYATGASFDREHLRKNWCDYLNWARSNPSHREIMHLLLESGLASEAVKAEIDEMAVPHAVWFNDALERGTIRGPNVEYIVKLAFFHLDLVVSQELQGQDEELAFEMFCQSIGLSK
ncbi:MAG: TetR/AcrR family transcriptional regulator [Pseudomonadota bacterium]